MKKMGGRDKGGPRRLGRPGSGEGVLVAGISFLASSSCVSRNTRDSTTRPLSAREAFCFQRTTLCFVTYDHQFFSFVPPIL